MFELKLYFFIIIILYINYLYTKLFKSISLIRFGFIMIIYFKYQYIYN